MSIHIDSWYFLEVTGCSFDPCHHVIDVTMRVLGPDTFITSRPANGTAIRAEPEKYVPSSWTDALILRSKRQHQAFGSIVLAETRLRLVDSFWDLSLKKKCSLSLLWLCLKIFDQIDYMNLYEIIQLWKITSDQLDVVSHIGIPSGNLT